MRKSQVHSGHNVNSKTAKIYLEQTGQLFKFKNTITGSQQVGILNSCQKKNISLLGVQGCASKQLLLCTPARTQQYAGAKTHHQIFMYVKSCTTH